MKDKTLRIEFGGGLGSCVAAICSWLTHHSVFWAILHFCCSWIYVVYWILVYSNLLK